MAAEPCAFSYSLDPADPVAGGQVTLTISLDNFDTIGNQIRGLQVDVSGIDLGELEIVSRDSLMPAPDPIPPGVSINTTSFASGRIRLTYIGIPTGPVTDVLQITFNILGTEAGSIELPVSYLVQTDAGQETYNDTITIDFDAAPTEIYDVDVTWGSMEFVYEDIWNPDTHDYDGIGWSCAADANKILVTSRSNVPVAVTFGYAAAGGYSAISGSFEDSGAVSINTPVVLAEGDDTPVSTAAYLKLTSAKPASAISSGTVIGTVTVTIGVPS